MAFLSLATSIVAAFGIYALYTLLKLLHQEFASSLRNLPGPKSKNWLLGHRPEILENVRCYGFLCIQFHNLFAVGRSRRTVDLAVWAHVENKYSFRGEYLDSHCAMSGILGSSVAFTPPIARRYNTSCRTVICIRNRPRGGMFWVAWLARVRLPCTDWN